jgi:hypothetical protein
VKRGLVFDPSQWRWSSFRYYAYDEAGPVLVKAQQPVKLKWRSPPVEAAGDEKEAV